MEVITFPVVGEMLLLFRVFILLFPTGRYQACEIQLYSLIQHSRRKQPYDQHIKPTAVTYAITSIPNQRL